MNDGLGMSLLRARTPSVIRAQRRALLAKKHDFDTLETWALRRADLAAVLFDRGLKINDIALLMGIETSSAKYTLRAADRISTRPKASKSYEDQSWYDLLPPQVAERQARWDFANRVWRARQAGATLEEIADKIGRSRARVGHISIRGRKQTERKLPSPLERWLAVGDEELKEKIRYLARHEIAEKRRAFLLERQRRNLEKYEREELARLKAKYEN